MTAVVEFLGERRDLDPDHDFTFGRAADLCIDESNLYLHRVVGMLRSRDDTWWLHNVGEWLELEVLTVNGNRHVMVPGTRLAVVSPCEVKFTAGKARYMIGITPDEAHSQDDGFQVISDAPATNRFGVIPINEEQRLLLVALCEHRLVQSDKPNRIPSNREVALRLGWSITKFNRKLDYLCRRFTQEGVVGLRGGRGERATERRDHLIDHVLATGLISEIDLNLID